MKKFLSTCVTGALLALSLTFSVSAYSDPANGDWSQKSVILKNTSEAELVVRTGDIDACNDEYAVSDNGYDPFTAKSQYAHGYPWVKDEDDPAGSDRIFVGSSWKGEGRDGYSSNYISTKTETIRQTPTETALLACLWSTMRPVSQLITLYFSFV